MAEPGYEERLKAAYPIPPELFDRLYEDWSTLPRFQRTRGVLRLMSAVIYALWRSGDAAPLIMPGGVPLDSERVRSELTQYLEDDFKPSSMPTSTATRLRLRPSTGTGRVEELDLTAQQAAQARSRRDAADRRCLPLAAGPLPARPTGR